MPIQHSRHLWFTFLFGAVLLTAGYFIFWTQPAEGTPGEIRTTRISVSSAGAEGNQGSSYPAVAAVKDNQNATHYFVAFSSDADNLVSDDHNGDTDVFVRNLQTHQTRRVSLTAAGQEANGDSWDPALAVRLNGQGQPCLIITYASAATNIVANDTNQVTDIFVRDECIGNTIRVSIANGEQADGLSLQPSISSDGKRIAFSSMATNLGGPDNGVSDIFVRDRQSGETRHISNIVPPGGLPKAPAPMPIEKGSWNPAISADGRYIAYEGLHPEWLGGHDWAQNSIQVLVYDWETGVTDVASVGPVAQKEGGFVDEPGRGDSLKPSIASTTYSSDQPCYIVAFESLADWGNLQEGNNVRDVFVRNDCIQTTSRIALHREFGTPFSKNSTAPSISAVTRIGNDYSFYVAFQSWAVVQELNTVYDPAFVLEESEGEKLDSDIYVYFIEPGQDPVVDIVSIDNNASVLALGSNGGPFRGDSLTPFISEDGCFVVFKSRATNLEEANQTPIYDANYEVDIFTRYRCDI